LDAGTPVQALHPSGEKVAVTRVLKETTGSEPQFSRSMLCRELALAGAVEPPQAVTAPRRVSFQGLLELSRSPGTAPIARLQLSKAASFGVVEERKPWRHVVGDAEDGLPYSFDAWTNKEAGGEPEMGMIGLLNVLDASHVSTAELPLFTEPNVHSPQATLAADVWLKAGKVVNDFVSVEIGDVWGPEKREFWVEQRALSKHARRLDP